MDFALSDIENRLVEDARAFARRLTESFGVDPWMTRDLWQFWGSNGWLAVCMPEEFGGGGQRALSAVLAFEAMGRAGVSRSQLFAVGAHLFGCAMALSRFGSTAQKDEWAPRLCSGDAVGALAFSEPAGGSDLSSCETLLADCDSGYRLDGHKTLITNGMEADLFVVLAQLPSALAPFNVSTLLVPRATPGLEVTSIEKTEGLAQSGQAEMAMTGCVVGENALLGKLGGGMGVMLGIMQCERACILAGFLGALDRDLIAVTGHLAARGPAGAKAIAHQAVQHKLAIVRTRIEAARWLLYRSAWGVDTGDRSLIHASMSKYTLANTLVDCTMELHEVAAGAVWKGELGLGRALADVMGILSASGTGHVQLNTIASQLDRP